MFLEIMRVMVILWALASKKGHVSAIFEENLEPVSSSL